MVLARRSLAARLNSGFLNCISGARSEYLGTRRLRAAGMLPGAAAAERVPAPVSSGWRGRLGVAGFDRLRHCCLRAGLVFLDVGIPAGLRLKSAAGGVWSNHSLGVWSNHIK